MLSEELFIENITQILQCKIEFSEFMMCCELVYSEEVQQDNTMFTDYYYLYYNYELNCMLHFKETTIGDIDIFDEVVNEKTIGYEILKQFSFK